MRQQAPAGPSVLAGFNDAVVNCPADVAHAHSATLRHVRMTQAQYDDDTSDTQAQLSQAERRASCTAGCCEERDGAPDDEWPHISEAGFANGDRVHCGHCVTHNSMLAVLPSRSPRCTIFEATCETQ